MKQIHVFFADPSFICREGLKQVFNLHDWVRISGEASDTVQLLQQLPQVKCDVVFTEIDFEQKGEGFQACREITLQFFRGAQRIPAESFLCRKPFFCNFIQFVIISPTNIIKNKYFKGFILYSFLS